MSGRALRVSMAALSLATAGIAAYLLWAHYSGGSVVCSTGGCQTVEQSRYAEIFGVPVALLGLLGSAAILLTLWRDDTRARAAGLALATAGFLFAAYLVVLQLTVIGAICEWCVANDALLALVAVGAGWRVRRDLSPPARAS